MDEDQVECLKTDVLGFSVSELSYSKKTDLLTFLDATKAIGFARLGLNEVQKVDEEEDMDDFNYDDLDMEVLEDPDEVKEELEIPQAEVK